MISPMEKQKPCYALQIPNQSQESCSEYSALLETLYVVTGTIVHFQSMAQKICHARDVIYIILCGQISGWTKLYPGLLGFTKKLAKMASVWVKSQVEFWPDPTLQITQDKMFLKNWTELLCLMRKVEQFVNNCVQYYFLHQIGMASGMATRMASRLIYTEI